MKIVDLRCCSTCPHGDRCTLPPGHDTGHNHADCPCNEPDVSSDGEGEEPRALTWSWPPRV